MFIRVLSAMIGLVLLLWILFSGGAVLYISAFIVTMLGFFEYFRAQKIPNILLVLSGIGFGFLLMDMLYFENRFLFPILVLYILSVLTVSLVFEIEQKSLSLATVGLLYVGLPMLTILKIHQLDHRFIWYIFLISFMTDTSAYFSGTYLGKHKLLPKISPKKTVEGAIGGVLGCMVSGVVYSLLFFPDLIWITMPVVAVGSVAGQIGDLVASKFKREAQIKDFGTIMPGHGGMLDRFDSILFVAPVIYMFLLFFAGR